VTLFKRKKIKNKIQLSKHLASTYVECRYRPTIRLSQSGTSALSCLTAPLFGVPSFTFSSVACGSSAADWITRILDFWL